MSSPIRRVVRVSIPRTAMQRGMVILMLSLYISACGTRPYQSEMSIQKANNNLALAPQTGGDHDSLLLAQKYTQKAEEYYKAGEYQKAEVKAQVGNKYAL